MMGRRPRTEPTGRERSILAALASGHTLQEVGDAWGVSRQRVQQIAKRWGLTGDSFGQAAKKSKKIADARTKKSEQIMRKLNMTLEEYEHRRKSDPILWRVQYERFFRRKLYMQRKFPDIPWDIKFGDIVWPTHCPVTGRKIDYFAMGVGNADGPSFFTRDEAAGYVIGNVIVMSLGACRQLLSKQGRYGVEKARANGKTIGRINTRHIPQLKKQGE